MWMWAGTIILAGFLEQVGFELGLPEGFRESRKEERGLPGMLQLGVGT